MMMIGVVVVLCGCTVIDCIAAMVPGLVLFKVMEISREKEQMRGFYIQIKNILIICVVGLRDLSVLDWSLSKVQGGIHITKEPRISPRGRGEEVGVPLVDHVELFLDLRGELIVRVHSD